jgi:hypothetical protein
VLLPEVGVLLPLGPSSTVTPITAGESVQGAVWEILNTKYCYVNCVKLSIVAESTKYGKSRMVYVKHDSSDVIWQRILVRCAPASRNILTYEVTNQHTDSLNICLMPAFPHFCMISATR